MTARGCAVQLRPKSLRIWRAIAAAGVSGIGSMPLYRQFRGELSNIEISTALQSLTLGGYAKRVGLNRFGCWMLTEACKLPKGEAAPEWLAEAALARSNAADALEEAREAAERRKRVVVFLPRWPASVFNLGASLGSGEGAAS